ncbi:hypothetical protein PIB30_074933 [Stylosanthes scabra]|uniref:Uncharacterized protein n=1 Tax=Stylosanthes scabra TaxID=79078 RepID=A0ABU6RPP0_9FABA|nr:hypothetical protein [Stylosanthes scabra]
MPAVAMNAYQLNDLWKDAACKRKTLWSEKRSKDGGGGRQIAKRDEYDVTTVIKWRTLVKSGGVRMKWVLEFESGGTLRQGVYEGEELL